MNDCTCSVRPVVVAYQPDHYSQFSVIIVASAYFTSPFLFCIRNYHSDLCCPSDDSRTAPDYLIYSVPACIAGATTIKLLSLFNLLYLSRTRLHHCLARGRSSAYDRTMRSILVLLVYWWKNNARTERFRTGRAGRLVAS